jgi:RNA-directed DNA polymerase
VKNALEPFWEARFEGISYGFRPGRGGHDAIEKVFRVARSNTTRPWVLDADIEGAFDNIGHAVLGKAIGNFPARELIKQWLKAGYVEEEMWHATDAGVPQGGVISPLLLYFTRLWMRLFSALVCALATSRLAPVSVSSQRMKQPWPLPQALARL